MPWTHRPYRDEQDFHLLISFLSACNGARPDLGYLQPGDLTWWTRQNTVFDPCAEIELFENAAGELLGFVFTDTPGWAVVQATPDAHADLLGAMLDLAEDKAQTPAVPLVVRAFGADSVLVSALVARGYVAGDHSTPRFEIRPGQAVPVPELPAGFSVVSVGNTPEQLRARTELHRAVWHPSRVTLPAYLHLRASPTYTPELDMVLAAPNGDLAAYVLGWNDPATRMGVLEPVGTHQDYRQQGLARLLVLAALQRFAELGAERVYVCTSESNLAAVRLYTSCGFVVTGRYLDYQHLGDQRHGDRAKAQT